MDPIDKDRLDRVVNAATPKQLAAMVNIYWRVRNEWARSEDALGCKTPKHLSYQQWLNHARPQWDPSYYTGSNGRGTVYIAYYNMVMGIEPDGHCHT